MPSKSDKQKRFFDWMAHDDKAAVDHGIKPEVAQEWHDADVALKEEREKNEKKEEDNKS